MIARLHQYLHTQSTSPGRYLLEQTVFASVAWIPGLAGIGLRGILYKLILHSQGLPAIEHGVRLVQPGNIHLGRNVYLDHGVYIHACPHGVDIGDDTLVMHQAELHVYNFRNLPNARIRIGRGCIIGEFNVIRGSGGVEISDHVVTGPFVQIYSSNHKFERTDLPIVEQGVTAKGVVIEEGAWLGANAIVLDGVRIGRNSVIGAGAIVSSDVPPYTLAVGVPARPTRDLRERAVPKQDGSNAYEDMMSGIATRLRQKGRRR